MSGLESDRDDVALLFPTTPSSTTLVPNFMHAFPIASSEKCAPRKMSRAKPKKSKEPKPDAYTAWLHYGAIAVAPMAVAEGESLAIAA